MSNLLSTSLSGMIAFQRALEMTGHNIANANTPGYSRQVAQLTTREGQGQGSGFIGTGTQISTIRRVYDEVLGQQVQTSATNHARFDALNSLAGRLDTLLADPSTGLNAQLESFFGSVQNVANDPASRPTRQALLGEADGLVLRFSEINRQLDELDGEINLRVTQAVSDINQLTSSIADLNDEIVVAQSRFGQPPNDLLDQRDLLIRDLSELVSISTVKQSDGAVNVFIGSGQNLVTGIDANPLSTRPSEFDPTRTEVVLQTPNNAVPISNSLTGGTIGGLLEFRSSILDPARDSLGRTAQTIAQSVNEQHASGMDLYGNLGGDFFSIDPPAVLYSNTNTGSGTAAATITDLGALSGDNYYLEYDGANYGLRRVDGGQSVALSGSGTPADPFVAEGLSITVAGAPAAGDRVLIAPTRYGADSLARAIDDPQAIAMAAPTRSLADIGNIGNGSITPTTIVDRTDPGLLNTAIIEFTGPNTYSINGAGSFAYTAGDPITINGSEVTISGAPSTGDRFTIEANTGASGDNRNGLLLADVQTVGILENGTVSINESYGQLVSSVGGSTRQIQLNLEAQTVILANAENAQMAKSGVNLDEEAANLLKYQQAYQAAAQVVSIASTLFDTLLNATRR